MLGAWWRNVGAGKLPDTNVAESLARVPCRAAQVKSERDATRIEPHEELHIVTFGLRIAAIERHPEFGLVGGGAAKIVLADAG